MKESWTIAELAPAQDRRDVPAGATPAWESSAT
jgi:hypothetical protein